MSDVGFSWLDALLRGAVLALLLAPAATWAAWRLAAGLARGRRVALAVAAAYGAVALAAAGWALLFEPSADQDDALLGALVPGALLQAIACPILLLASRRTS